MYLGKVLSDLLKMYNNVTNDVRSKLVGVFSNEIDPSLMNEGELSRFEKAYDQHARFCESMMLSYQTMMLNQEKTENLESFLDKMIGDLRVKSMSTSNVFYEVLLTSAKKIN